MLRDLRAFLYHSICSLKTRTVIIHIYNFFGHYKSILCSPILDQEIHLISLL